MKRCFLTLWNRVGGASSVLNLAVSSSVTSLGMAWRARGRVGGREREGGREGGRERRRERERERGKEGGREVCWR